ncbi:spermidine synthase [SAR202 cluster bacterium AC-409-J13_OGT_754m]|nr:spermidine synthase [SAR202 cluster bacterium AC-409-J13_OGT_754m]
MILGYRIKKILYSGKTEYQSVDIIETDTLGTSLVLDGKTQSTSVDEYIYHESLVHPAMIAHSNPRKVFIGGGGEGATLREVLNHRSVEAVVMLDLDSEVVDLCRNYLAKHSDGSFDDNRLTLIHADAREYLLNSNELFDVIILDLVDPLEEGTAYTLYTKEFYTIAKNRLNADGILVTQSGPSGLLHYKECFSPIYRTLMTIFPDVRPYNIHIPAFGTMWGFSLAFAERQESEVFDYEAVDRKIEERIISTLKAYDSVTHKHMFSLPLYLRNGLDEETRIVKDDNPVFMI